MAKLRMAFHFYSTNKASYWQFGVILCLNYDFCSFIYTYLQSNVILTPKNNRAYLFIYLSLERSYESPRSGP